MSIINIFSILDIIEYLRLVCQHYLMIDVTRICFKIELLGKPGFHKIKKNRMVLTSDEAM